MVLSGIFYDLLLAPYRIGKMQENKKLFYLLSSFQWLYFFFPGLLLLAVVLVYLVLLNLLYVGYIFCELIVNSKLYKYPEEDFLVPSVKKQF